MLVKTNRLQALFMGLVMCASPVWVSAQVEDDDVTPSQTQTQFGDWTAICSGEALQSCQALQALNATENDVPVRVLVASVQKVPDGTLLVLEMPLGLDLRPGVALQFDMSDEINLPYAVCYSGGCQVVFLLSEEHEALFRRAGVMKVGFRMFGQTEVFVAELSLRGSAAALRSLPEPAALENAEAREDDAQDDDEQ